MSGIPECTGNVIANMSSNLNEHAPSRSPADSLLEFPELDHRAANMAERQPVNPIQPLPPRPMEAVQVEPRRENPDMPSQDQEAGRPAGGIVGAGGVVGAEGVVGAAGNAVVERVQQAGVQDQARRQQRARRRWRARQNRMNRLVNVLYAMADSYRGGGINKRWYDPHQRRQ